MLLFSFSRALAPKSTCVTTTRRRVSTLAGPRRRSFTSERTQSVSVTAADWTNRRWVFAEQQWHSLRGLIPSSCKYVCFPRARCVLRVIPVYPRVLPTVERPRPLHPCACALRIASIIWVPLIVRGIMHPMRKLYRRKQDHICHFLLLLCATCFVTRRCAV